MTATDHAVELIRAAALAAAEKLATDQLAYDVSEQLAITDAFLLASGGNDRQVRAIVEEIEDKLRELDAKPIRREGHRVVDLEAATGAEQHETRQPGERAHAVLIGEGIAALVELDPAVVQAPVALVIQDAVGHRSSLRWTRGDYTGKQRGPRAVRRRERCGRRDQRLRAIVGAKGIRGLVAEHIQVRAVRSLLDGERRERKEGKVS